MSQSLVDLIWLSSKVEVFTGGFFALLNIVNIGKIRFMKLINFEMHEKGYHFEQHANTFHFPRGLIFKNVLDQIRRCFHEDFILSSLRE